MLGIIADAKWKSTNAGQFIFAPCPSSEIKINRDSLPKPFTTEMEIGTLIKTKV